MEALPVIIIGGLVFLPVLGVVAYLFLRGRRRLAALRRRLGGARPASTGRLGEGLVAILGRCQAKELLEAPFSGVQVCGYRVRVVELQGQMTTTGIAREKVVMDTTRVADLVLQDNDGEVRIDGKDAVLLGADALYGDTGLLQGGPPEKVTSYLAAYGHFGAPGMGLGRKLCWYEYRLAPGDTVLVVGAWTGEALGAPVGEKLILADRDLGALLGALDELDLPPELIRKEE